MKRLYIILTIGFFVLHGFVCGMDHEIFSNEDAQRLISYYMTGGEGLPLNKIHIKPGKKSCSVKSCSVNVKRPILVSKVFPIKDNKVMKVNPDGVVIRCLNDNTVYNTKTDFPSDILAQAVSFDGDTIAVGCCDGFVSIYNHDFAKKSLQKLFEFKAHANKIFALALTEDGKKLITGSRDCQAKIWDLSERKCIKEVHCTAAVRDVVFSPGGESFVAFDAYARTLLITNIDTEKAIPLVTHNGTLTIGYVPENIPNKLVFGPEKDGKVAISYESGGVRLYDIQCPNVVVRYAIKADLNSCYVTDMSFSPNGEMILISANVIPKNKVASIFYFKAAWIFIFEVKTGKLLYRYSCDRDCSGVFIDNKSVCIAKKDGAMDIFELPNEEWYLESPDLAHLVLRMLETQPGNSFKGDFVDWLTLKKLELPALNFLQCHVPMEWYKGEGAVDSENEAVVSEEVKKDEPTLWWRTALLGVVALGFMGGVYYLTTNYKNMKKLIGRILTFLPVQL